MNAATDRKRIGRAFHRQAGEYDRYASVQKRIVSRLDQLVATHLANPPGSLLDIGCGTGALLAALYKRYSQARSCGVDLAFNMSRQSAACCGSYAMIVNGDAEQLPFSDEAFDLVVSASTFQWINQLDLCFEECFRVLKKGGLLCVAFFCGKTLWELQESYRKAVVSRFGDDDSRVERLQRFRDVAEVRRILAGLGFDQAVIVSEIEMEYHADVPELLRSIKGIGASTVARNDTGGGLGWRGVLSDLSAIYGSRFKKDEGIPATYEIMYIIVRNEQ